MIARLTFLLIVVLAAIFTPQDPVTMVMMVLLLSLAFSLAGAAILLFAWYFIARKRPSQPAGGDAP